MPLRGDFSRQSFLGANSEEIFANLRVGIVGLGGGGSHIAQQLAHLGVGHYRLLDPDYIEESNLNRLVGATQTDVENKMPKVDISRRLILGIRPWAEVWTEQKTWQEADMMLRDVHVIFGCVDGFQQRDFLEAAARRFHIPYIDIGMDVTKVGALSYAVAGQMLMTLPGGPCMRCLGFIKQEKLSREENRYGDAGHNPQVVWTNGMLASLAVGAFVQLFTPWCDHRSDFQWIELDGNMQTAQPSRRPEYIPREAACPHYGLNDALGDPFINIQSGTGTKTA